MGNLDLALLSPSTAVKSVSGNRSVSSRDSSEKGFSGILAREESYRDDTCERDAIASKELSNSNSSGRSNAAEKKSVSDDKERSVKSELSDDTLENTEDVTSVGANAYVKVPSEDTVKETLAKNGNVDGFAEVVIQPELLVDVSESVTDPDVVSVSISNSPELVFETSKPTISGRDGEIVDESTSEQASLLLSSAVVDEADDTLEGDGSQVWSREENLTGVEEENHPAKGVKAEAVEQPVGKPRVKSSGYELITEKPAIGMIDLQDIAQAITETVPADPDHAAESNPVAPAAEAPEVVTANAAPLITPVLSKNGTDSPRQGRMVESQSGKGVSIDELPGDDLEIRVEGEAVVLDKKLQQKVNLSERMPLSPNSSGNESGTVHLQGRARENRALLLQDGQGQKGELQLADGEGRRGKAVFAEDLKSSMPDSSTSVTSLSGGAKEKALIETASAKPLSLTTLHSEVDSGSAAIKKSANSMLSKSLPITDDHLLNQIQAGLSKPVNGRQSVTIKLWPEHLGRVDIKLVMNKQHLTATFMVDHSEVKEAMMRKIDSLRDSLGLHGISAKDIAIKVAPAKSGDGMSFMADNQSHNSNGNSAWRQFNAGGFSDGNSQSQRGWGEADSDGQIPAGVEGGEELTSYRDNGFDPGSLHISA